MGCLRASLLFLLFFSFWRIINVIIKLNRESFASAIYYILLQKQTRHITLMARVIEVTMANIGVLIGFFIAVFAMKVILTMFTGAIIPALAFIIVFYIFWKML